MRLFAISDLHLAFQVDKPMDIFGPRWENHHEQIKRYWEKEVSQEDIVILGGDLSWALKLEDVKEDLNFIDSLPGRKILIKGNHDYWWGSYKKVRQILPSSIYAIQNNYFPFDAYKKVAICGTRGWLIPDMSEEHAAHNSEQKHNQKIYNREVNRLDLSLQSAWKDGFTNSIVTIHYPPFCRSKGNGSGFIDVMNKYNVKVCVYGHLHGEDHYKAFVGSKQGIDFYFTSADYLQFKPQKIDLEVFN